MAMQASSGSSSSHHVSPISCPPVEKPVVTLADVLRGGAETDRRSLQAYLHTLAAREKEKRKRKRAERKTKRSSSSSSSSKRKKRGDEDPANAQNSGSSATTPSSSVDMSAVMMRGSVDLSAMRSTEYDAMRGSVDLSDHHMRSRSVDFGALRANTAAFDAMRASLDMSAMGPGLGAHYSHHGSFAGYQGGHGSFAHRASVDFDAMSFGADISPTSSFCMEGPVFLEPAPLASFSVDEQQPHQFQQPQALSQQYHQHQQSSMASQTQQPVITDLPDFEDFVSSAFLQAFPEEDDGFNAALLEPGVPEQQPSPEAAQQSVFAVPAPPQHILQRSQSPAPIHSHHQQSHSQVYQHQTQAQAYAQAQAQRACSCPDCHVTPVSGPAANELCHQPGSVTVDQPGSQVVQNSLSQSFAVEEDQVESFLAQFIEWSEHRGAGSPVSVPSPAASLYY